VVTRTSASESTLALQVILAKFLAGSLGWLTRRVPAFLVAFSLSLTFVVALSSLPALILLVGGLGIPLLRSAFGGVGPMLLFLLFWVLGSEGLSTRGNRTGELVPSPLEAITLEDGAGTLEEVLVSFVRMSWGHALIVTEVNCQCFNMAKVSHDQRLKNLCWGNFLQSR